MGGERDLLPATATATATATIVGLLLATLATVPAGATPWPNVRPLTDRSFERTPARLERGRYLAEGLLQCAVCHSERDWSKPGAPPVAGKEYAGAVWSAREGRRLVAPNLTPDPETGAGRWTDDMLARAIREGVSHDGRPLHPQMWSSSFRSLPDEDLASVVVYLRSLPAVRNPLPRTELPDAALQGLAARLKPITAPVAPPPARTPAERGAHLLELADCGGCHTSWHTPRMPGLLAGGNRIVRDDVAAVSTNLTPHATGMPYGADTFVEVMRTGRWNTLSPAMPWIAFRNLSDADLRDLHAALTTAPPVAHAISNAEAPTQCAVCGAVHGGGERSVLERRVPVPVEAARLARYVGRYHLATYDEAVQVSLRDGVLRLSTGDAEFEMVPTADARFDVPGWTLPVEFVVAGDGAAASAMITAGPWHDRYERVPGP